MRLVGGHGDDGDAEVDPQHVDDAEAEEGQAGVQFNTFWNLRLELRCKLRQGLRTRLGRYHIGQQLRLWLRLGLRTVQSVY